KGVGILIARRVAPLEPWVRGGPQEGGVVGGTENVAGIAGAAVAVMKAVQQQAERAARWAPMRDALEARIVAGLPGAKAWGHGAGRVANTTFISVPGIEAEAALMQLSQRGIHAASGAACSSSEPEPSHVLLAMGASRAEAHGALRLSLPPEGIAAGDIPAAADTIIDVLQRLQRDTQQPGRAPEGSA
ncbi:MAG TPA: aminotransferase class V-fold PLP-dependent enzyme, partial [Planctomycetota bacterium]|nr:aminotransferase class V-fold PLP-dependent enzyme [Planctomycetota bacterium]